ncbi:MAG: hypothetical protein OXH52_16230 [Gammaproteobacteria bacterium]|nr:hypothetical protein [Gammaproteobacteria bacterium]
MAANIQHEVVAGYQPNDQDLRIWRYVDLPRLIDFLETRSLHFARVDTLGDPYEGTVTRLNVVAREAQLAVMARDAPPQAGVSAESLRQSFASATTMLRGTGYVSCWHAGETESAAMWQLYGTTTGTVVLQSTYDRLRRILPDDTRVGGVPTTVYLGMVQYKDYSSVRDWIPGGNVMYPLMHKRLEFQHEREVRAFIWNTNILDRPGDGPRGLRVGIEIDDLVETIRVQPTTPTWIRQAIERLLARYNLRFEVRPSQIDTPPMF